MQSKTLNGFLSNSYYDIVLMSKRICKGNREYEEVAHYVISKFIEHKRAEELIEKNEAMKFMSGMIHLSFYSSTSPYHTLYRQKGRMHTLYDTTSENRIDEEYNYEADLAVGAIQGILEEMQGEGVEQWYRSMLFGMWIDNQNFSELERKTKIPRTSISQAVQECREYIKQELKNRNIDYDI